MAAVERGLQSDRTMKRGCVLVLLALASPAAADAIDYRFLEIRHVAEGARVSWSPDGRTIAFDRAGEDGLYDLWLMRPDGGDQRCLSCEHPDFPAGRQIGQPVWHPSGEWLVVQVEKADHHADMHSNPGHGIYHDLWALNLATDRAYPLTDVSDGHDGTPQGGTLHPVFSHDGTRLLWSDLEDYCAGCGVVGDWRMLLADFVPGDPPALANVTEHQPGENGHWYETHGFGPDDSWIYFAGNTAGTWELWSDINRLSLADGSLERLTRTAGPRVDEDGAYDEHAHFTRAFDAFVWLNDENNRGEYWIADADGSDRYELTGFNVEGTPEHELVGGRRSVAADNSWNPLPPEGREQLAAYIMVGWDPIARENIEDMIVVVELAHDAGGGGTRPEIARAPRNRRCSASAVGAGAGEGVITAMLALLGSVRSLRRRPAREPAASRRGKG
jgi:Tol biopolymer transport system component